MTRFPPFLSPSSSASGSVSGGSVPPPPLSLYIYARPLVRFDPFGFASWSRKRQRSTFLHPLLSTFKADKYLKESRQAYARNLLAFADDREAVVVARSDFQRFYFFYHHNVPCIDAYFIETDSPFRYRASAALASNRRISLLISMLTERTRIREIEDLTVVQ